MVCLSIGVFIYLLRTSPMMTEGTKCDIEMWNRSGVILTKCEVEFDNEVGNSMTSFGYMSPGATASIDSVLLTLPASGKFVWRDGDGEPQSVEFYVDERTPSSGSRSLRFRRTLVFRVGPSNKLTVFLDQKQESGYSR